MPVGQWDWTPCKGSTLFLGAYLGMGRSNSTLALPNHCTLEHSFDPAAILYFPFLLCTFKIIIYLFMLW
jgi:hypothetical protein